MTTSTTTTAERILQAARRQFNEKGYDATTLTDIAAEVGITQGNLTYHFPTKHELVLALREELMARITARAETMRPGDVIDDYVERLVFMLDINATYRSLLRDRMRFADAPSTPGPTPEMIASLDELKTLLERFRRRGVLRSDIDIDIETLSTTIYIVGRHWPDHLREMEGRVEMTSEDLRRGAAHHLTVVLPYLTAAGRRELSAAVERACASRSDPPPAGGP